MAEKITIVRLKLTGAKESEAELARLQKTVNRVRESRKKLNKLRKEGKINDDQLARAQVKLNKKYTIASQKLRDLTKAQLRNTGALRKARTVGDSVVTSMGKLALRFAGVAAAVMVFKNVINTFKKFQQANADLASILGKTRAEIGDLTEDAKRLGSVTAFTATEVSQLQKEFAKLGFSTQEILDATEATLALAAATGTDLARAAEVTGSTVRAFGLDASESQRVVDVMAKSFSSSALDMEKFATAMRSVAPVAKNAGLEIEGTTALLGVLTNRGIDASTSGTALRNVFLELSKQGLTFEEAMTKINTATDKNKVALELFGKRGATVSIILAETAEETENLEEKLNDAAGAAQRMADEQLDTLEGKLTILASAWEGFILNLEDGEGAMAATIENIVSVATELLRLATGTADAREELDESETTIRNVADKVIFLGKVLATLTIAYVTHRIVLATTVILQKALTFAQLAYAKVTSLLTGKINIATIATRAFNAAQRANPLGLIITLLVTAATAMSAFGSSTSDATDELDLQKDAQEGLNKAVAEGRRLRTSVKTIEEDIKVLGLLNKAQVEDLRDRINTENEILNEADGIREKGRIRAAEDIIRLEGLVKEAKDKGVATDVFERALQFELDTQASAGALRIKAELGLTESYIKIKGDELVEFTKLVNARMVVLAKEEESGKKLTEKEIKEADRREKEEKKRADEKIREIKRLAQLQLDVIKQLDRAEIENIQDKQEREEAQRLFQFDQRIANLSEDKEFEAALIKELEEKLLADLDAIRKKWSDKEKTDGDKDIADDEAARRRVNDAKLEIAGKTINSLATLNEASIAIQLKGVEEGSAREAQILKQAGQRRKVVAIAEVGVNLAKEISAINAAAAANIANPITFGAAGVTQASILTAIAIVTSAANVALIASQKFAKGGIANGGVFQGNSHANGGIPFAVGGVGFEAEGGEAIINKRSTKRYRPLLSAINQAGGGVRFGHGGVTFQDGGIQAPMNAIEAISDSGMNDNFAETLASSINAQIASTRVINVVSDTTEAQTSVANAESEATFG